MGVQDRDWWRERGRERPESPRPGLSAWSGVCVILVALYVAWQWK